MLFDFIRCWSNTRTQRILIHRILNTSFNEIRHFKTKSKKNDTVYHKDTKNEAKNNYGKKITKKNPIILLTLSSGILFGFLFIYLSFKRTTNQKNIDLLGINTNLNDLTNPELDVSIKFDLNDVYEKTAIIFLSNPELREMIGMPIKIVSSESETDQMRSINIKRIGTDLFVFIAYDLIGTLNSGIVYCKLKWDKSNEKFQTESIILKLNKADAMNRTKLVIKNNKNAKI